MKGSVVSFQQGKFPKTNDPSKFGNKARHLFRLCDLGAIPVPPGFATTRVLKPGEITKRLAKLHADLVSVRSSPSISMPGMLETKLNIASCPHCVAKAINDVFNSWMSPKAVAWRKHNELEDADMGVIVQRMVFGDEPGNSGSGVVFTRNPNTGKKEINGEWLPNRQGDDVVSGMHTPLCISTMPTDMLNQLTSVAQYIENYSGEGQDIEFTFENGKLFILQTRKLQIKSTADKGSWPDVHELAIIAKGKPACHGQAEGKVVSPDELGQEGILVAETTTTDDITAMIRAKGFVTAIGGYTCHAAIVARSMNKPCIVGIGVDKYKAVKEMEYVAIDGYRGTIHEMS